MEYVGFSVGALEIIVLFGIYFKSGEEDGGNIEYRYKNFQPLFPILLSPHRVGNESGININI